MRRVSTEDLVGIEECNKTGNPLSTHSTIRQVHQKLNTEN